MLQLMTVSSAGHVACILRICCMLYQLMGRTRRLSVVAVFVARGGAAVTAGHHA